LAWNRHCDFLDKRELSQISLVDNRSLVKVRGVTDEMSTYAQWFRQRLRSIDRLESHPEPQECHFDELAQLIAEAGRRAGLAGLPAAVVACQIRSGPVGTDLARTILAECLAACPQDDSGPLTVAQAASRLNISTRQVYALCERGELRHSENPIRIPPDAIDDYQRRSVKEPMPYPAEEDYLR
jgi:excisionase family DNA binding protein